MAAASNNRMRPSPPAADSIRPAPRSKNEPRGADAPTDAQNPARHSEEQSRPSASRNMAAASNRTRPSPPAGDSIRPAPHNKNEMVARPRAPLASLENTHPRQMTPVSTCSDTGCHKAPRHQPSEQDSAMDSRPIKRVCMDPAEDSTEAGLRTKGNGQDLQNRECKVGEGGEMGRMEGDRGRKKKQKLKHRASEAPRVEGYEGARAGGVPSQTDGQSATSLKDATPKVSLKSSIKETDQMGNESKENIQPKEKILFRFRFENLDKLMIKVEGSNDEPLLTALMHSPHFKTNLEKSKKKGLLIHASKKLKAMVKGSLACGLLPPGELLKITLISQEQPEENIVPGRVRKLFFVAARGETKNKDRRVILSCKPPKNMAIRLAVCAPEHQTLLQALRGDGRFKGEHFENIFYLRPSDDSGDSEPGSKVGHLKGSAITYTLIVTGNRLLESNQPQDEKPEIVEAGKGDQTPTPQLDAMQENPSKTSTGAQKLEMPIFVQRRHFEALLLGEYKNLKFQRELFEEAFREENEKRDVSKGPFEICIEEFGKEIKNVTPIAVHELLAERGRSVGYIEWGNAVGIRRGFATCFVLRGPYIITNHHVLLKIAATKAAGTHRCTINPRVAKLARVSFNYKKLFPSEDDIWFDIESIICCNPDLDYAILQLKEKAGIPPGLAPNIHQDISDELMYIIGHPFGGPKSTDTCKILSYSERTADYDEKVYKGRANIHILADCGGVFLDQDIECFHMLAQHRDKHRQFLQQPDILAYNTSFFEGSSGSPVFSSSGVLIALHTAGCIGKYEWTKQYIIEFGYSIKAIYVDMEAKNIPIFQYLNNKMEVDYNTEIKVGILDEL